LGELKIQDLVRGEIFAAISCRSGVNWFSLREKRGGFGAEARTETMGDGKTGDRE